MPSGLHWDYSIYRLFSGRQVWGTRVAREKSGRFWVLSEREMNARSQPCDEGAAQMNHPVHGQEVASVEKDFENSN